MHFLFRANFNRNTREIAEKSSDNGRIHVVDGKRRLKTVSLGILWERPISIDQEYTLYPTVDFYKQADDAE